MTDQPHPAPPVETELKFELAPGQIRLLSRHPAFAQEPALKRMSSTYFDTPSFALRAAGFTLRVRRSGGKYMQTVKRDRGGLFERDEWEAPVSALRVEIKALDETPAGKVLAKSGEPLVPVAVVKNQRDMRQWADAESVIEIAFDRCEVQAGSSSHKFLELELELKQGQPAALHDLARELFALSPVQLNLTSKGERGYRLAGAKEAGFDPDLTPEMPFADAFAAVGKACLSQIVGQAAGFRAKPEPEGIHQTRVGLRRLRTAFRLCEKIVTDQERARLNAEVEWISETLGPARNLDVFLEDVFVPERLSDPDVAKRYGDRLQRARRAAYKTCMAALSSERFAKLTLDLALWLEDGDWRHPPLHSERAAVLSGPVEPVAAQILEDVRKQVRKRGKALKELDVEDRHRLRIRCKRLRYASEFFAHAFKGGRKKRELFVGELKNLQNALGLLNDMAQAQESAAETLGKGAPKELIFAAGELVGRLRANQGKGLGKAEASYKALMKAERFWPEPGVRAEPTADPA